MKKTTKRTILFLGGVALALTLIVMPLGNEDGKPGWGMESSTQINL